MNSKNFLAAGIAGGITYFFLGWLCYGMLFADILRAHAGSATGVDRGEDMLLWSIALGNLASGFLLSYIFSRLAHIQTAVAGAKTGLWIGLLLAAGVNFTMYGTSNLFTLNGLFIDVLIYAGMSAFAGAVVAWVVGMAKS
jgi:hypothetical protein